MATIEGNEIALRKVASELVPPVRSGQDARTNQDDFGAPFVTKSYDLLPTYEVLDPNTGQILPQESLAPGWVYGMMVDTMGQAGQVVTPSPVPVKFFASFGARQELNEIEVTPGKVLLFPRGARRVFMRHNSQLSQLNIQVSVTWILDRFATLQSAGNTGTQITRQWVGTIEYSSIDPANLPSGVKVFEFGGATNFNLVLYNASNRSYNWEVKAWTNTPGIGSNFVVIDSGTLAAGVTRMFSYGPGIAGTNPPNSVGHGFMIPTFATIEFTPNNLPVAGLLEWSWRGV